MNNNLTILFEQLKEKSCKRSPSNNWLDLDKKSINLHWKIKAKNKNKIRQHDKTNPSLNSPSPFPLSNPFFCSNSCHYNCQCHPTRQLPVMHAACPLSPTPHSLQRRQWQQRFFRISSSGCVQIISTSLHWSKIALSNFRLDWSPRSPPPPLPPCLPHNKGTINNHRRHHHSAPALPNALLLPLILRFHQATASTAKLAAAAVLPPPPPLPPRCQRCATTAYKI